MFKKRELFAFKTSYLLVFKSLIISCNTNDNKPSQNNDANSQTSKVFHLTVPNNSPRSLKTAKCRLRKN